jgi:hypothetical protein
MDPKLTRGACPALGACSIDTSNLSFPSVCGLRHDFHSSDDRLWETTEDDCCLPLLTCYHGGSSVALAISWSGKTRIGAETMANLLDRWRRGERSHLFTDIGTDLCLAREGSWACRPSIPVLRPYWGNFNWRVGNPFGITGFLNVNIRYLQPDSDYARTTSHEHRRRDRSLQILITEYISKEMVDFEKGIEISSRRKSKILVQGR